MSKRALGIAMQARCFAILADKPELLRPDARERILILLRDGGLGGVPAFDTVHIKHATEMDLLCGYAVRLLRAEGAKLKSVLDLLGILSQDRLLAILWALPADRRDAIRRADGTWGYVAQQIDAEELAAAIDFVAVLSDPSDTSHRAAILATMNPRDEAEAQRFDRVLSGVEEATPEDEEKFARAREFVEEMQPLLDLVTS